MKHIAVATALALALAPLPALAIGGQSDEEEAPPVPTETTVKCTAPQVWDMTTKACKDPKDARLDDDTRYRAAREYAWAGQPGAALTVLAAMTEGNTDRVLTYRAFASRKAGRIEDGLALYAEALAVNPGNLLARSYLGMAYVEIGATAEAQAQLDEIRARGGAGRWPELALAEAIATGMTTGY
jgi:thioredoxin-like negative regulator of GroEL